MTRWIDPLPTNMETPLPGLHPLVGQALIRRGFLERAAAQAFLDPQAYRPSPSTDLPGLDAAAERIIQAIRRDEPVCVWGDFDVDGQTSTTVLVQSLAALGAKVSYHIPVRQYESHGVNIENLARVIAQGAKLVITCDTGISALDEVDYARSRGVGMVITDHHDLPPQLPRAEAVVNPKMLPRDHPLSSLAGVGVAYKLAEELINRLQPGGFQADSLLDLAALGLVADLAILRGDTRHLVQTGLVQLRGTQRLGLKILMSLAELSANNLTEEHIGFALGPRLNAMGRLSDANPVVELLTTSDPVRARVLATLLEGLNAERKLLCDQVYRAAEARLQANPELLTQPVIILAHPQWPGGIVGIVASQLVERYQKPAILLASPEGGLARGSARSVEGLNITAAIAAQADLLNGYGGHPMAAGLSLEAENLPEFRRRMSKTVAGMLGESPEGESQLEIDAWLGLDEAGLELAGELERLAPFGPGNKKLTLASHGLTIKSSAKLGKNHEHLKLTVADENGNTRQVLWWDGGLEEPPAGKFDLAFTLRASDWKGTHQAQMELVDFRLLEPEKLKLQGRPLEVLDYRGKSGGLEILAQLQQAGDTVCWAEGEAKKVVNGQDRNELAPAWTLIVWTSPASLQDLRDALKKVHPERVAIFALDPGTSDVKAFLARLAGLVKFVLNKKGGKTSLAELAAATAQVEMAVWYGLDWLAAQGQIGLGVEPGGSLALSTAGSPRPQDSEPALAMLNSILAESQAYRRLFQNQANVNLEG